MCIRDRHRTVLENLEDFNLLIAGFRDGAELVIVQDIVDGERAVGGNVRVEGNNRAGCVEVRDREAAVVCNQFFCVVGIGAV